MIIIENKINYAKDTANQLPKYVKHLVDENFSISAIIYLNLNNDKEPDRSTWNESKEIIGIINSKMIVMKAYDEKINTDLLRGWLNPCELRAKNFDSITILKQYSKLIQKLGFQDMNKLIMDKFYEILQGNEKYETAKAIKDMMNSLPNYVVEKIVEKFKSNYLPFEGIYNYKGYIAYFDKLKIEDSFLALDIELEPESKSKPEMTFKVEFFDREKDENGIHNTIIIKKILEKTGLIDSFKCEDNGMYKYQGLFKIPSDDEKLYELIHKILDDLRVYKRNYV